MIATASGKTRQASDSTAHFAHLFSSDLGWIGLAWRGEVLTRLTFGHSGPQAAAAALPERLDLADSERQLPVSLRRTVVRLQRFAAGTEDSFLDLAIDLDHCTPFQRQVVQACRAIEAGSTRSYRDLAVACGSPRAARAVGNVMRSNRYPLVVPCHRVIGSNGKLCGFTSPQGLAMKQRLLDREGLALPLLRPATSN
jgi:methylated-DNA-[protein]-cysteine S-methyltransferase